MINAEEDFDAILDQIDALESEIQRLSEERDHLTYILTRLATEYCEAFEVNFKGCTLCFLVFVRASNKGVEFTSACSWECDSNFVEVPKQWFQYNRFQNPSGENK